MEPSSEQNVIDDKHQEATDVLHEVSTIDKGEILHAQEATHLQHSITLKDAFRLYRPAIAWSFLFSLGVVMAGFDPQLVGTLVAIPTFQKQFGVDVGDGKYAIQAQCNSAPPF